MNELGLVLQNLEKFPDAEAAFRHSESINEKIYGLQSNETAANLNNLADLYRIEGRYADGRKVGSSRRFRSMKNCLARMILSWL